MIKIERLEGNPMVAPKTMRFPVAVEVSAIAVNAMMPVAAGVGQRLPRAIIEAPFGDETVLDDGGRRLPNRAAARAEAEAGAPG